MKPYFAKLVPVEGPIKAGDKYILGKSLGLAAYGKGYIGTAVIDFTPEAQRDQEAKILKLFLCSRDIKVGDKAKWSKSDPWGVISEIGGSRENGDDYIVIKDYENGQKLNPNDCTFESSYKIIGPISPEATWVKEGDEFDENEVREVAIVKNGNGFMFATLPIPQEFITGYCYQLKGPCGRFH